jgi:uncharacterized BrkB/YihY/UPF0761 family membrane protein
MPSWRSRPGRSSGSAGRPGSRLARCRGVRQDGSVIGAILIVLVLLVIPVLVFMTGAVVAAVLGHFLKRDVEAEYEGTEYVGLS